MNLKPFELIAEVGVNHLGSVKLAKGMIDAGIDAGLRLFKFQIYHVENEFNETPEWKWYDYMKHCELTKEEHFELRDYCDQKGVIYFASVFGDWSLSIAEEMEMPLYKLASRSVYTKDGDISPLAEKIYALGKPVISSLGYRQEFWPIPLRENNSNLYCVSKYPTTRADVKWPGFQHEVSFVTPHDKDVKLPESAKNKQVDGFLVQETRGNYHVVVDPNTFEVIRVEGTKHSYRSVSGFSDHSIGTELAKEAINLGATIIEKHFTIDKTLYGPDQKGSSLPSEMKEILEYGNSRVNAGLQRSRPS